VSDNIYYKSNVPLGRVWHERTVIVKKEEQGFGFTLSHERPVFVDKIYYGSSAHRACILEGDRIIKVSRTIPSYLISVM